MSLSRYINNYYKIKKKNNGGLLPSAAEYKSMWCSLVSSNTVVCAWGVGWGGGYSTFQVTGMIQGFFWVSNFRFQDFFG